MERTEFRIIMGLPVRVREATAKDQAESMGQIKECDLVLCRCDNDEIVATVRPEDFFDEHGNRFSY